MASAELQIPEHIQETQNITREELEMAGANFIIETVGELADFLLRI